MAEMYADRARAITGLLVAVIPFLIVTLVTVFAGFVVVALFLPLYGLFRALFS